MKNLLQFIGKYKKYFILGPCFVCIDVLFEMTIPRIMERIVDVGVKNADMNYILFNGGIMLLLALGAIISGVGSIRCSSVAAQGFGANVRKGLFEKIQSFSFSNIEKFSTASLITRTTSDITAIQFAVMLGLRLMIRGPLMVVGATAMAINIDSELARIFFIAIPILAIVIGILMYKGYPLFMVMQKKIDALNATIQENLTGIRTVKAFVREDFEQEKFKKANDDLTNTAIKASSIIIIMMPALITVIYICEIAALWFGGQRVGLGTMQAGSLMSFMSYVTQLLISLMLISMAFLFIARSRASVQRINEVFNTEADIEDSKEVGKKQFISKGEILFDHVDFKYDKNGEENVLTDISLRFKPGQVTALIGGTGAAKSTLVNLIPRLYDVTAGRVTIDGQDVREYPLEGLREGIGMVLQENVLFAGTINENMRWGKPDATDEEIQSACKKAQAHDFILSFPEGYNTMIEQGGVNVSGGQRQRLCIARALMKNPKILIMDDSTSAVDTATEARIRVACKAELKDTTVIIIAQRISSVQGADQIVILDDGKVIGEGTHQELLQNNSVYQEINSSQEEGRSE